MKSLVQANRALLEQAATLIAELDDARYRRPMPAFASGSIGQHLRHVLDHYQAVLGTANGYVDYDRRRRDSRLESCRDTGIAEIRQVLDALGHVSDEPVLISSEVSPEEKIVVSAESSLKRELLFATSHAVHHFALIAMLLRVQGVVVPESFGMAPATLTYQRTVGGASMKRSDVFLHVTM